MIIPVARCMPIGRRTAAARVAHEVDGVEVLQLIEEARDELRADAAATVGRQNLEQGDEGVEGAVEIAFTKPTTWGARLAREDDAVAAAQDLEMSLW